MSLAYIDENEPGLEGLCCKMRRKRQESERECFTENELSVHLYRLGY